VSISPLSAGDYYCCYCYFHLFDSCVRVRVIKCVCCCCDSSYIVTVMGHYHSSQANEPSDCCSPEMFLFILICVCVCVSERVRVVVVMATYCRGNGLLPLVAGERAVGLLQPGDVGDGALRVDLLELVE